jgi:hypothetical protein
MSHKCNYSIRLSMFRSFFHNMTHNIEKDNLIIHKWRWISSDSSSSPSTSSGNFFSFMYFDRGTPAHEESWNERDDQTNELNRFKVLMCTRQTIVLNCLPLLVLTQKDIKRRFARLFGLWSYKSVSYEWEYQSLLIFT